MSTESLIVEARKEIEIAVAALTSYDIQKDKVKIRRAYDSINNARKALGSALKED